jgi:hypothetical protein
MAFLRCSPFEGLTAVLWFCVTKGLPRPPTMMRQLFVTRFFPLTALALLTGCATHPSIQSNVDLDQLIKGKSKALPDREEAIPNTYFELTAWTGDSSKAPQTATSATGISGSGSQVACASADEKNGTAHTGRCEITVAGIKYTLKARDTITFKGSGEVVLSCAGDAPARCKALVVN